MITKDILESHEKAIQDLYLKDKVPWVIGFSGGKDSTATLQLIYKAISKLPFDKQTSKPIWVLSSDTRVEIPSVVNRVKKTLSLIEAHSKSKMLPFSTIHVKPNMNNSFFVNIIGRGYPAPTRIFRWCTDKMKIQPSNDFIKSKVDRWGDVIVILGTRKAESSRRAQSMDKFEIKNTSLRKHASLPSAYIYSPIEDWTVDDVWTYLSSSKSPWGDDNKELSAIYRKAAGDECPVVVDTSTSSCGNSRFGCWVCTVVEQDKSIQGFINNGDTWLQPMADFRNMIKEMREMRVEYRTPDPSKNGGYGPFTQDARIKILTALLEAEKEIQKKFNERLISSEELIAIDHLWKFDGSFKTSVREIYKSVYKGMSLAEGHEDIAIDLDTSEDLFLVELCEEEAFDYSIIKQLLHVEKDLTRLKRRHGVFARLDSVLSSSDSS
jgi:DNA sulfur modification protein DndC